MDCCRLGINTPEPQNSACLRYRFTASEMRAQAWWVLLCPPGGGRRTLRIRRGVFVVLLR